MSEPALHSISRELHDYYPDFLNIEFTLGNACNKNLLKKYLKKTN